MTRAQLAIAAGISTLLSCVVVACGGDERSVTAGSIREVAESGTTTDVRDLCFDLVGDESEVSAIVGEPMTYDSTVRAQPAKYVDQLWCSFVSRRTNAALRIRFAVGQLPNSTVPDGESQDGGDGTLSLHRQDGDLGVTAEVVGGCNYDTGECASSFPLIQLIGDLKAVRDEIFDRIS